MESNLVQAVVAVLAVLLISMQCGRALWYVMWRPYAVAWWFRQQGIQGPPYKILFGSLPEIRRLLISGRANALDAGCHNYASLVQPFFQKWASDYGKTFLYWLGPIPAICSTDMTIVKQVLGDRTHLFQKDYLNPKFEIILGKGLIFVNGDDWKRHRRVVHPVFNQEKLVSMSAMASECAQQMMERWFAKIKNGNDHQAETDMLGDFDELTLTVIARVIYGENNQDARDIFQLLQEVRDLTISSFLDPPIPWFRYLPTRRNRRSRQLDNFVTSKIRRLIHERLARKDTEGGYGDDVLGVTVKAWSESGTLSVQEIIGECKTFLAAGQDTGANLLTWAMFLLSSYPEWQEKVREEVLRECPDSIEVHSVEAMGKLKLLNMTLLETLRLYNPVPFLLRKTAKDTILADIRVPKGTTITIPIAMLHRDEDIWGADANAFNPMRFESVASRAHPNALLSFSLNRLHHHSAGNDLVQDGFC
ncbi:cytochrome P450 709B2-like [Lolium rigidum]|uniref:cytochrome P450 709B2-like n=1 Tax=Lolium rigidum TaxID=89674 RepID=UPI001F5CE884|nr:cytochrome P450 709B2-like [Lolium rigidum]